MVGKKFKYCELGFNLYPVLLILTGLVHIRELVGEIKKLRTES